LHIAQWPAGLGDGLVLYGGCGLVLLAEVFVRRQQKKEAKHADAVAA
jgi:hypothetical protein